MEKLHEDYGTYNILKMRLRKITAFYREDYEDKTGAILYRKYHNTNEQQYPTEKCNVLWSTIFSSGSRENIFIYFII